MVGRPCHRVLQWSSQYELWDPPENSDCCTRASEIYDHGQCFCENHIRSSCTKNVQILHNAWLHVERRGLLWSVKAHVWLTGFSWESMIDWIHKSLLWAPRSRIRGPPVTSRGSTSVGPTVNCNGPPHLNPVNHTWASVRNVLINESALRLLQQQNPVVCISASCRTFLAGKESSER